jgi:hypothetical protein
MKYLLYWADLDERPGISDIDIRLAVAKIYPQAKLKETETIIKTVSNVLQAIPTDEVAFRTRSVPTFMVGYIYSSDLILKDLDHPDLNLRAFNDEGPIKLGETVVSVPYMNGNPAVNFLMTGYSSTEAVYTCTYVDEGLNQLLAMSKKPGTQVPSMSLWVPEYECELDCGD